MTLGDSRRWIRLAVLAALGAGAASGRWLTMGRDAILGRDRATFFVTSGSDGGAGSLREAIFAADRADRAATIVFSTNRVTIQTPLPPLVNPRGVKLDAREKSTELDARVLAGSAVIEIRSPDSSIEGLQIRGAGGAAVLVRGPRAHLNRVTVKESVDGVVLTNEASDAIIESSRFEGNDTGIRIGDIVERVTVRNNTFLRHEQAGIRAVSPRASAAAAAAGLQIRSNRFEGDRMSVVLIHLGGRVDQNVFTSARESALFLMGRGAVISRNRVTDGVAIGIMADQTDDALIEGNELDHNAAIGLLLRAGDGTVAQGNRVYSNGYGIAVVFGGATRPQVVRENLLLGQTQDALFILGASPLLAKNRVLASRVAALRMLEFVPLKGSRLAAKPQLDANVFTNNMVNMPVYGEYRVPPPVREND